jgi:hypothetical protein
MCLVEWDRVDSDRRARIVYLESQWHYYTHHRRPPGTYQTWTGGAFTCTLNIVDRPGDGPVGVPEPASLILFGVGGLAAGALRRRKEA